MVETYGPLHGFGWHLNEIVGAQIARPTVGLLVDRESRAAVSPADLYTRLAQHIRDPTARQAFLAAPPR